MQNVPKNLKVLPTQLNSQLSNNFSDVNDCLGFLCIVFYQIFYSLTEFVDVYYWKVFLLLGLEGGLVCANERKHFPGNVV